MKNSVPKIFKNAGEFYCENKSRYDYHKSQISGLISECRDSKERNKLLDTLKASAKDEMTYVSFSFNTLLVFIAIVTVSSTTASRLDNDLYFCLIIILILFLSIVFLPVMRKIKIFQNRHIDLTLIIEICERLEKEYASEDEKRIFQKVKKRKKNKY